MRLFIGLPLPQDLKNSVLEAWLPYTEKFKFRAVPQELWHLTIAFLDDVPEAELPGLVELMEGALKKSPGGTWSFSQFETFPPKKPSNLIAHAEPQNYAAWKKFVDNLRDVISLLAPRVDRKPWQPHVTIGKAPKNMRLPVWNESIKPIAWQPESIALIQSKLTAQGPIYTHLHEFKLI